MDTAKTEPNKKKLTNFLALLTLVSCFASFLTGFNFLLVNDKAMLFQNITTQVVEKTSTDAQIHPALLVFTVLAFILGCLFGCLLFGPLADKCGRKGALMINDLISIASTIILVVSRSVYLHAGLFALSLFVCGVCTGIFSCAVPMYLGEISPTNLRGGLSILPVMAFSVGMLMSQVLGDREILGTEKGLPYLICIPGILALFQLFLLLLIPESPRYLLIQKRDEEGARQALKKLRGQDDVEDEIEELRQEDLYERKEKQMTVLKLLHSPRQRWQLVCVVSLFATQQFSGISTAYYYADKLYLVVKVDEQNIRYISALIHVLVLVVNGLSVYVIDSWGRRPLLLIGFGISIISCVLLTMTLELQGIITWIPYVSCFLLFIFITGIAMGPGTIPPLMITELFLQSSRSSAHAVGGFAQWSFIFLVGFTFNLIEKYIRAYSFLIYLPFCIAGFFYILKVVPETKRKTFLEIRKLLEIYLVKKYLNVKPAAIKRPDRS